MTAENIRAEVDGMPQQETSIRPQSVTAENVMMTHPGNACFADFNSAAVCDCGERYLSPTFRTRIG